MRKIIYKDFFVTFKSRFYYVVGVFVFGVALLSLYGIYHTLFENNITSNYAIFQMVNANNNGFFDYAAEIISGNFLSLFVAISVPVIICEAFGNGYIKNIYNFSEQKKYYIIGKLVSIFSVIAFYVFITLLATGISGIVMFKFKGIGNVKKYIVFVLLHILCNVAFGCVIMLISELFRKLSISMIIGVIYVVMLCDLLYQTINSVVLHLVNVKFDISDYTVMGNMTKLTMDSEKGDIIRTVLISVAFIAVFSVLTHILFLRRDVNCNEK
ncbi:MAG: hypothetical protein LBM05_01855 [Endomicrobium sp.]|jgi:ABC-type transport system involved in multi-copper enzyme maturation permease subunit|nr:hypothetical protein [Endomicrobium sp.]